MHASVPGYLGCFLYPRYYLYCRILLVFTRAALPNSYYYTYDLKVVVSWFLLGFTIRLVIRGHLWNIQGMSQSQSSKWPPPHTHFNSHECHCCHLLPGDLTGNSSADSWITSATLFLPEFLLALLQSWSQQLALDNHQWSETVWA